jgi:hypothetical protein
MPMLQMLDSRMGRLGAGSPYRDTNQFHYKRNDHNFRRRSYRHHNQLCCHGRLDRIHFRRALYTVWTVVCIPLA